MVDDLLNEADLKRKCTRSVKLVEHENPAEAIKMRSSKKDSGKRYKKETLAAAKGFKTGRWSRTEHLRFVQAIKLYGESNYEALKHHIGSRSGKQIRSHQ